MLELDVSKLTPAEEVCEHPAFHTAIWTLTPEQKGFVEVAHGRKAGPINIYWQMHGHGPIKILLVCGILARHHAWQRQTLYFGHINGDRYSVLICDNRGSGLSDKPWFYSTSEMAKDLIEVLDHVGWTDPRSLHIAGLSMGGMIMQELGLLIPERIGSLNLVHTAAKIQQSWSERWEVIAKMFRKPQTMDESLRECAYTMFSHRWLLAPDDCQPPQKGMPGVVMPEGIGEYRMFDNNFQRYAAQEINRQRYSGFGEADKLASVGHVIACLVHNKTDQQLVEIADRVGRQRLLVLHTTKDRMIPRHHGDRLMRVMQPGVALMNDEDGHVPKLEKARWFCELLQERIEDGERQTTAEMEEAASKGFEYTGEYEVPERSAPQTSWGKGVKVCLFLLFILLAYQIISRGRIFIPHPF